MLASAMQLHTKNIFAAIALVLLSMLLEQQRSAQWPQPIRSA
jgi:hypothetical protein